MGEDAMEDYQKILILKDARDRLIGKKVRVTQIIGFGGNAKEKITVVKVEEILPWADMRKDVIYSFVGDKGENLEIGPNTKVEIVPEEETPTE